LITIVFCAVAWIGIQYLGYAEFSIAGKMLFSGDFQKTLKVQLELHAFEREIEKSASLEECWLVLRKTAEGCGFHCKCLYIDSDLCFQAERPAGAADEWNLRVPLSETSYLELARPFRSEVSSGVVGPFVDVIHGSLRPKIEGLAQIEIVGSKGKIRAGLAAAGGA
jgi:hypothetical protein